MPSHSWTTLVLSVVHRPHPLREGKSGALSRGTSNQIAERLRHNFFCPYFTASAVDRVMIFIVTILAVRAKNLDFVLQTFPLV